jgi:hypothetical protein
MAAGVEVAILHRVFRAISIFGSEIRLARH